LLAHEQEIDGRLRAILSQKITATRIRCHGDFHLGQVLQTGDDFLIIDFEGEPGRPLGQRRIKRTPLRDVAGMLRSFHYAPWALLLGQTAGSDFRPEDLERLRPAAHFWYRWVSAAYLRSYLAAAGESSFIPRDPAQISLLLDLYMFEKALYEIGYELNSRPDWVGIPLRGILELTGAYQ
jgi:maltose alpha-D-glucosyltransferase/alpha-amylase